MASAWSSMARSGFAAPGNSMICCCFRTLPGKLWKPPAPRNSFGSPYDKLLRRAGYLLRQGARTQQNVHSHFTEDFISCARGYHDCVCLTSLQFFFRDDGRLQFHAQRCDFFIRQKEFSSPVGHLPSIRRRDLHADFARRADSAGHRERNGHNVPGIQCDFRDFRSRQMRELVRSAKFLVEIPRRSERELQRIRSERNAHWADVKVPWSRWRSWWLLCRLHIREN